MGQFGGLSHATFSHYGSLLNCLGCSSPRESSVRFILARENYSNAPFAGEYHVEDLQVFQDVKVVHAEEGIRPVNSFEVAGGYALCAAGNFASLDQRL